MYSTASAFVKKLCLWKMQLASGVTTHFSTISNHKTSASFDAYNRITGYLIDEFERRISRMNSSLPLMKMFANPMSVDATTATYNFQLELLEIKSDVELRQAFESEGQLGSWSRVPEEKYNLKANAPKNTSVFGSTYVCEALFSKMIRIKNQYRNR